MNAPSDNCPSCLNGPNSPHTIDSGGVSVVGAYRCPVCGETWTCSWSVAGLVVEEVDDDAA